MLINIIINEDCPNICSLWMGNFLLSLALVKENLTAVRRSFHIYWTAFSRALLWDVEAHNGLEISKLVFKISAKACTSHLQSWKKVETLFLPLFFSKFLNFLEPFYMMLTLIDLKSVIFLVHVLSYFHIDVMTSSLLTRHFNLGDIFNTMVWILLLCHHHIVEYHTKLHFCLNFTVVSSSYSYDHTNPKIICSSKSCL